MACVSGPLFKAIIPPVFLALRTSTGLCLAHTPHCSSAGAKRGLEQAYASRRLSVTRQPFPTPVRPPAPLALLRALLYNAADLAGCSPASALAKEGGKRRGKGSLLIGGRQTGPRASVPSHAAFITHRFWLCCRRLLN